MIEFVVDIFYIIVRDVVLVVLVVGDREFLWYGGIIC